MIKQKLCHCLKVRTCHCICTTQPNAIFQVYREEIYDGRGWVESRRKVPLFSRDLQSMITIRPVRDSSAGHFAQVVRVDIGPGHSSAAASSNAASLTHGKFEVTELVDWDEENHFM